MWSERRAPKVGCSNDRCEGLVVVLVTHLSDRSDHQERFVVVLEIVLQQEVCEFERECDRAGAPSPICPLLFVFRCDHRSGEDDHCFCGCCCCCGGQSDGPC